MLFLDAFVGAVQTNACLIGGKFGRQRIVNVLYEINTCVLSLSLSQLGLDQITDFFVIFCFKG